MNVKVTRSNYTGDEPRRRRYKRATTEPYNPGEHRCYSEIEQKLKTFICFIKIQDACWLPNPKMAFRINYCGLGFNVLEEENVPLIFYANSVKGAAGQAVQKMNIILGCDEYFVLDFFDLYPV